MIGVVILALYGIFTTLVIIETENIKRKKEIPVGSLETSVEERLSRGL